MNGQCQTSADTKIPQLTYWLSVQHRVHRTLEALLFTCNERNICTGNNFPLRVLSTYKVTVRDIRIDTGEAEVAEHYPDVNIWDLRPKTASLGNILNGFSHYMQHIRWCCEFLTGTEVALRCFECCGSMCAVQVFGLMWTNSRR